MYNPNKLIHIFVISILIWSTMITWTSASVKEFSAIGEYTMSDYETPAIADERALAYAVRNAVEKAGVYVESYTHAEKMTVTEDTVEAITNTVLQVKNKVTKKITTESGDVRILVEITVQVDTASIENILRDKVEKRQEMTRQYNELQKIKSYQKISFKTLIQSFVSVFLLQPHIGYRHESRLLQKYKGQIFLDSQSKWPYYVASLISSKIESLLKKQQIDKKYIEYCFIFFIYF